MVFAAGRRGFLLGKLLLNALAQLFQQVGIGCLARHADGADQRLAFERPCPTNTSPSIPSSRAAPISSGEIILRSF
jgi:hypothetical protein